MNMVTAPMRSLGPRQANDRTRAARRSEGHRRRGRCLHGRIDGWAHARNRSSACFGKRVSPWRICRVALWRNAVAAAGIDAAASLRLPKFAPARDRTERSNSNHSICLVGWNALLEDAGETYEFVGGDRGGGGNGRALFTRRRARNP